MTNSSDRSQVGVFKNILCSLISRSDLFLNDSLATYLVHIGKMRAGLGTSALGTERIS